MKILIVSTKNSCHSQIAEGFLHAYDQNLEVFSAGTDPNCEVHQNAIDAMHEIGIDIHNQKPKKVDQFFHESFDYLVTMTDDALEKVAEFNGDIKHKYHININDLKPIGRLKDELYGSYQTLRDLLYLELKEFCRTKLM